MGVRLVRLAGINGNVQRFVEDTGAVSPDVGCHQGYTSDGTYKYTIDSGTLQRRDSSWNLLTTNATPFSGLDAAVNHAGDGQVHGGSLYVPIEQFASTSSYSLMGIGVYDATTLARTSVIDTTAEAMEVAGLCVVADHGDNGIIYVCSFVDGTGLWKYDLDDGSYLGKITFSTPLQYLQGVAWDATRSRFYLANNVGALRIADIDGNIVGTGYVSANTGSHEGLHVESDGSLSWLWDQGANQRKVHSFDLTTATGFTVTEYGQMGFGTDSPLAVVHVGSDPDSGSVTANHGKASGVAIGPEGQTPVYLWWYESKGLKLEGHVSFKADTSTEFQMGGIVDPDTGGGDSVHRWARYSSGREELGSGSGARDTFRYRAAAGVWAMENAIQFPVAITAASAPNNTLFRNSADGKLYYKDNSGTSNALY